MTKKEKESVDKIICDYSRTWTLLHQYDQGTLKVRRSKLKKKVQSKYELMLCAVDEMVKILQT